VAGVSNGVIATVPPSSEAWHHLAASYDGSLLMSLYIDGQLVTQQVASGSVPVSIDSLAIGGQPGGTLVTFLNGTIDDVRLYGSALTAAQIAQLFNTDTVGDSIPNWWRLQYFGTSSSTDATSCATCDLSGTGQNNFFKYVAGLDPFDPTSVFELRIDRVANQPIQDQLLFNPVSPGRTYTTLFSTNLTLGGWQPLSSYSGPLTNFDQVTITDTNAVEPYKFYKIKISLP
jgi:hypothetical protein